MAVAAGMATSAMTSISSALYRHARSRSPSIAAISARYLVGVPGGVAGHLAQVARPRLGERPRLVEAAEHREQRCPRAVLGTRGPPVGELVDHPHRVVDRPRAEDQRPLQPRARTVSSRRGAGSEAPGARLRRRRRAAGGTPRRRRASPRAAQAGVDHPALPRVEAQHGRARSPRPWRRARRRSCAPVGPSHARASPRSGHRRPRRVR